MNWIILLSFLTSLIPTPSWAGSTDTLLERERGSGGSEFFVGQTTGIRIAVNLLGGIRSPGIYHIPENTDIVTLMGFGGGNNEFAKLGDVSIKRRKGDSYEILDIDLKDLVTTADKKTPRLQNGDVVFVPESRMSQNLVLVLSIVSTVLSITLAGYAVSQLKK